MRAKVLILAALVPLLGACDDTIGPDADNQVDVRFQAVTTTAASALRAPGASYDHVPADGAITLTGDNGTLVIEDIRLIVDEIELERLDGECVDGLDDDCEEFEGGPFLVDLLDGGAADAVVTDLVPAGTYTELEFEVEDLDIDEDEEDDASEIAALLAEMREDYDQFPAGASMVVHGTFNGEPFTVYFAAEIEVENEFAAPFTVPEDGDILVNLMPERWFELDGDVLDPRPFDGQTIAFEAEFEFESGVDVDRDDEEDDD